MPRVRADARFVADNREISDDMTLYTGGYEVRAKAEQRDPKVFKRNLRQLWQRSRLTGPQVVKRIGNGAKADWFRHLLSDGLSRVDQRTAERLYRLARLFGLKSVEDLWNPDLVGVVVAKTGSLSTDNWATRQAWEKDKFWPRMAKYKELLESGRFEFLEELIDRLHAGYRREISEERRARHQGSDDEEEASEEEKEQYRRLRSSGGGLRQD